jgi:outer membrane protein assembly factor BamB
VKNNQVVWEKVNDHIMPMEYAYTSYGTEYNTAFIKGDFLIKIFPAKDDPGNLSYYTNAVYFEKINKYTGDIITSKKIIASPEISGSLRYSISKVVADGDLFIFGCNNGYIYCYDINGNNVWKKANFPIKDSDLGNNKANIFLDERKIYFFTVNPASGFNELYCLDTQTGGTVWHTPGSSYGADRGVFFDKVNIYVIHPCGYYFLNKLTGAYVNGAPYSGCSSFIGRAIGSIDGVTAIFFAKRNEIGVVHVPIPDPIPKHYFTDNPFNGNYFLEQGLIYGGGQSVDITYLNKFTFACYSYERSSFNWKFSYPMPPDVIGTDLKTLFNYKNLGNEIYILANFHVENGNVVPNESKPHAPPYDLYYKFTYPGVIVLDKQSGSIKKQIIKMPGGPNGAFAYHFCVE